MSIGVKIPVHETIVFNLENAGVNCLLKQHMACVFFIGEQFVNCFPIPFEFACWGWDALPLQTRGDFSKTVASQISLKYPAYNLSLVRIYHQLTI